MLRALVGLLAVFSLWSLNQPAFGQAPVPTWVTAANQYYIQVKDCWARYDKRQIKTFAEATKCGDAGAIQAFEQAQHPHMDLVRLIVAENAAVAERVSRGKITPTEGMAQRAAVESRVLTEIKQRQATYAQAVAQANAARQAQAAADARVAQIQAQMDAADEEQRRLAMLRFSAGILAPTTTGRFGESLSNGMAGYGGRR